GPAHPYAHRSEPSPVHPHVRGACGPMGGDAYYGYGPSPRAWGLLEISATEWGALRSIPTCVGPAHTFHSSYQARSVHPHVRGACVHVVQLGVLVDGPSPRAWGLRAGTRRWCRRRRSIPTCVGPAFLDEARVAAGPVHPHVRGACQGHRVQGRSVCGPSPRAWGLPGGVPARTDPARSIPTCVGPAGAPTPSWSASTVHPHVRGACCGSHLAAQSLSGPSPRAWDSDFPTCANFHRYRYAIKTTGATREPVTTPSPFAAAPMATATPLLSPLRTRNTGWQH